MVFNQSGTVSFPADGSPREFRYKVAAEDETLQIWLKDTRTKEEWETKPLQVADFVTLATALPQAQAEQYAARVAQCLDPVSEWDKPTRSLSRVGADGSRVLCVGFTLEVGAFATQLEYSFSLAAIERDPTEALEARVQDLELVVESLAAANEAVRNDMLQSLAHSQQLSLNVAALVAENAKLRQEVAHLKTAKATEASGTQVRAEFHAAAMTYPHDAIAWTPTGPVDASQFVVSNGTELQVVEGGHFTIFLSVLHESSNTNVPQIQVLLDGKSLRALNDHSAGSRQSTMLIATHMPPGSALQVFYRGNGHAFEESTLTFL